MKKSLMFRLVCSFIALLLFASCLTACNGSAQSDGAATTSNAPVDNASTTNDASTEDASDTTGAEPESGPEPVAELELSEDNPVPATREVSISFDQFNINGDNEVYIKEMIAEFNKVYPDISIEMQTVPFNGSIQQLMAKVSANEASDIYELSYEQFVPFASTGVVMPLDELANSLGIDLSKYNERVLEAFKYDDIQYGLPNSFSNVVMFYNKELFDQANIEYPTKDWTWVEILDAAKSIRALGDEYFGFHSPITYNALCKALAQNGSSILSADGKSFTVNTPEAVEAVQFMVDMVTTHNVQANSAQLGGMGDWDLFKSGRLGMILTGMWVIPDFLRDCDFEWDLQVEPGNKQKATNFFCNSFVINKDSEVAEEAMLFLDFLCSNQSVVDIRIDANLQLPAINDEESLNRYTAITPPDNRAAIFESLDYLVTLPVLEQANIAQDIVNAHLQSIVTGQVSAKDAMDACQAELDSKVTLN